MQETYIHHPEERQMHVMRLAICAAIVGQVLAVGAGLRNADAAGAVAAAYEQGASSRNYWAGSAPSAQAAESAAMASCQAGRRQFKHGTCTIAGSAEGPNYWVVFNADNGASGYGVSANRQAAIDSAYKECAKLGKCATTPAHVWFDDALALQSDGAKPAAGPPRPAVFRSVLANGQVSYSDTPPQVSRNTR